MAPITAREYLSELRTCLRMPLATYCSKVCDVNLAMDCAVDRIRRDQDRRLVVHLVGNGGSSSDVSHAQNDLIKACGIRAIVHQDTPTLTAYANDNGYENAYADQLRIWMKHGDVLIAVSSSGKSRNILNAAAVALNTVGAYLITFTGFEPNNPLRQLGHVNFYVPSSNYGYVEVTHAALLHCLTDRLAHVG